MILTLGYHTAEFLGRNLLIFLHCKNKKDMKKVRQLGIPSEHHADTDTLSSQPALILFSLQLLRYYKIWQIFPSMVASLVKHKGQR